MKEKTFGRVVGIWTLLIFIINLIYVPYLIKTTSGGGQAPMTFIVKSVLVWFLVSGIVFGIYRFTEKR